MAIVSWNVRGLNREEAVRQTKLLIKQYKPDLLFLMETKLADGKVNKIRISLGFDEGFEVSRMGLGGGLMVLWKEVVEVTHLTSSFNHFSCLLRWHKQQRPWHFCGFYGEPKAANRHFTWDLLQKLRIVDNGPWLVMGDFNEILSHADKEGGGVKNDAQIEAFRNSLEICELQPLEFRGDHFTWIRNTTETCIKERLDWAVANEVWLKRFLHYSLTHLDNYHSDHRALCLCLHDSPGLPLHNNKKRSRFRFENMWIQELECREIVTSNWTDTNQSALLSTINNIKQCADNLQVWHQSKFGSLAKDIKVTHQRIEHLHNIQDQLEDINEIKFMENNLNDLLLKEEIFWKQRSRVSWLKEGDRNTRFFHQSAKKRNKINKIKGMFTTDSFRL